MKPNKIISVHIVHILSEKYSLNCVKSVILKNKNGMERNECFFYHSAALIVFFKLHVTVIFQTNTPHGHFKWFLCFLPQIKPNYKH